MSNEFDVCFVDYRLGIKTGIDLLNEAIAQGCESPVILLTGKGVPDIDVTAIKSGAYDYLIKSDLNTEKLERCIRYALERAASLQALKANERKYRSIFEKSKDIVFITTSNFDIVDINYAATELLDYEVSELLSKSLFDIFKNKTDKFYFSDMLNETDEIFEYETDLLSKNGELKSCIISASMEVDNTGGRYMQGIIHDNSSRKKAEKSSLQAEKLAATGRLVKTLAHEVRNPLNNINLSLEQLVENNKSEEEKIYLDIVRRNSKRIDDLITELLDSSRLSSQIIMQRLSLQSVMDNAVSAAVDRMTLKHIQLQLCYPQSDCMVMLDVEKMELAFLNIIINAIEAMEAGKGILKISMVCSNEEAVVEITDNGSGISEENLQRLFEPYFTSKRNGMGLGLASSLNIIQSHKAMIDVKSEVGKGTSFIITFKISE